MTEEEISFDKPKSYSISKYRLLYSAVGVVAIVGTMIFDKEPTPPICFGFVGLLAIYLFVPLLYKLIVSDEAISSINFFGSRTLEWNEIAEIAVKNGNLILSNQDGNVKVTINQQIDDYPSVIKFIRQQRPELWCLDDISSFHQEYVESAFSFLMGIAALLGCVWVLFGDDMTANMMMPILFLFGISIIFMLSGLFRIRQLSLDGEMLVVQYLLWKRQFHVNDIWSVSLEPKFGRNILLYEVRIRVRDKNDIVVEKIREGNPILVNAVENWMKKYKGKQND